MKQVQLLARTVHITRVCIEFHELDCLVIRAGGNEISHGAPGQAINGAFVVFGALEQYRWLVGGVILPAVILEDLS